jgi:hypothetical protein
MRIPVLLVLAFSCVLPLAGAGEMPSAAVSVSTDSSLNAVRSSLPPGLTADDVIRKSGEVYKSAKTYYEESHIALSNQFGAEHHESASKVVAAFKRPFLCKIETTGAYNGTFYYRNGECVTLLPDQGKCIRRNTDQTVSELLGDQAPMSMLCYIATAPDPSAAIRKIVTDAPQLTVDEFNGRGVLALAHRYENVARLLYFDPDTFRLVGAMQRQEHKSRDGSMEIAQTTYTADRILLDELPVGPDGKPLDVFSFTLPEGVEVVKEPAAPAK